MRVAMAVLFVLQIAILYQRIIDPASYGSGSLSSFLFNWGTGIAGLIVLIVYLSKKYARKKKDINTMDEQ